MHQRRYPRFAGCGGLSTGVQRTPGPTITRVAYEFASPVTEAQLARLDDRPQIVQFDSALSQDDYRLVADWIQGRPQVTLRAYGAVGNLDFLRWFPRLMRFAVDARGLDDLDGLRHLPDNLESLRLGATKKRLSVRALSRFSEMRSLSLEGHTKDLDVVGGLTSLVDLTLRSSTVPSLEFLEPLDELRALDLKLGGTTDLGSLRHVGRLQYLELWQIRGLADISVVSELTHLEYLHLQSLRRVEQLPDLSTARDLRVLWIETMRGLDRSLAALERSSGRTRCADRHGPSQS